MKRDSIDAAHAARVAAVRAGDRMAVARAMTAVENDLPGADRLLADLASARGRAHVVGITGAPGAGKSTLISAMLRELSARGCRVAVVAVDPSSPLSGGSVLGDRVRMGESAAAANVFVRSIASRGHPGGVAKATSRMVDVVDAAGFDTVIVETVGAGQSEVDIAAIADTSVVVCPPGLGDEVQAIKAGILEIADVLVVSKGDSPQAGDTARQLSDMLRLRRTAPGWTVPVLTTVAPRDEGVAALVDACARHAEAAGRGRRLRGEGDVDPGALALARRFVERDGFVNHCGLELVEAGRTEGHATLAVTIRPEHVNFNGGCHGGLMFTIADTAFGLAANLAGFVAVGIDTHLAFHVGLREGDRLTARAYPVARGRRVATWRVDLTRGDGRMVATFSGTVFVTRQAHSPVDGPGDDDDDDAGADDGQSAPSTGSA